jgi:hypothetical protein
MCVIILVLCFFVIILFCKYLSLKKKNFTVHSAFEHRHRVVYELTCVCSTTAPHHTHTLMHGCV